MDTEDMNPIGWASFTRKRQLFKNYIDNKVLNSLPSCILPITDSREENIDAAYAWCQRHVQDNWIWGRWTHLRYVSIHFMHIEDLILFKLSNNLGRSNDT